MIEMARKQKVGRKPHADLGLPVADQRIQVVCTSEQRKSFEEAAQRTRAGMTASQWLRDLGLKALEQEQK